MLKGLCVSPCACRHCWSHARCGGQRRRAPPESPSRATSRRSSSRHCASCHRPRRRRPVQPDHLRRGARGARAQIAAVDRAAATCRRGSPSRVSATSPASAGSPTRRSRPDRPMGRGGTGSKASQRDLPPLPRWTGGWQLGAARSRRARCPSTRCAPTAPTSSATSSSPCRATATRYVRGLQFRPGRPRRASREHPRRSDARLAAARRRRCRRAGYEGLILHSADYPDGHFLGWTPGQAPPLAPRDLAWRLDAGTDLVVQLHLQPTGKPEPHRSRRSASTSAIEPPARDAGHRPARAAGSRHSRRAPPTTASTDAYVLPVDAEVRAIQPHAHYRARSVERLGDAAGRRPPAADPRSQLGLQLAGPVPLRVAVLAAGRDHARDGVRVRQLGREPAQPEHPAAQRVGWGWRSIRRDGRRLDSGDDAHRRRPRAARAPTSAARWPPKTRRLRDAGRARAGPRRSAQRRGQPVPRARPAAARAVGNNNRF